MKLQYTNVKKDKDGKDVTETREITAYTNNYERSDGIDTLGQEFSFDLADNPFDFNMMGTRLAIGGKIEFSNQVSNNNKSATTTLNEEPKEEVVFQGIIVSEKQSGANKYTYTCFDYCFYLNKSEIEIQFNGVSGLEAIKKVCKENDVPLGNVADIKTKIKKIYQGQPVSDVIKDIIKQATEETGYKYRLEYREGKVHVEDYKDLVLDKVITQPINNYSRDLSMEDMRNSIVAISSKEKSKSVKSTIQDDESIKKYGLIKKIIKVDDKKQAQTAQIAKKTIQDSNKIKEKLSLTLLGDDTVRSGRVIIINDYTVDIHDKFLVTNCKHNYGVNHTMTLDLKRVEAELDTSKYKTSTTTTVTPNATNSTANATQVDAGMNALNGYESVYRDNGCVDVAVKAGSYYSPFLKQQADIGTADVDTLVNNAQNAGYKVETFNGYANKGDILVYGNNQHVVISDGAGGCFGNSTSAGHAKFYPDANYAWHNGEAPTKVIKMS